MGALAEMGKEEKKVRKGMEKLGMVPLDGLTQVAVSALLSSRITARTRVPMSALWQARVTLSDGTVMMMRMPEAETESAIFDPALSFTFIWTGVCASASSDQSRPR